MPSPTGACEGLAETLAGGTARAPVSFVSPEMLIRPPRGLAGFDHVGEVLGLLLVARPATLAQVLENRRRRGMAQARARTRAAGARTGFFARGGTRAAVGDLDHRSRGEALLQGA